jgi:hypothetical protein
MVVIHLKSVPPAKSVLPAKSILPAKSVSPEKFIISSDSENSESAEEQVRRIQTVRTKGKGKAVAENEPNPNEARAEMKVLMKTIPPNFQLKVEEVFSSPKNKEILGRLVPELLNSMTPRYKPSRKQMYEWLGALHCHQRGRYRKLQTGKLDADNQRLHANSRLSEVRTIELLYYTLLCMY